MLGILEDSLGTGIDVGNIYDEIKIVRDTEDKAIQHIQLLTVGTYVVGISVVAVGILVVDVGCIDIEGSLDSLG